MEKEKNNKKQLNIYVYSVLMFILFIVTFLIIHVFLSSYIYINISENIFSIDIIFEAILAVLAFIVMLFWKNSYVFTQENEKFTSSLKYGFFYLIVGSFFGIINLLQVFGNISGILNIALYCFLIGIYEEFLLRGWLLNEFLERYGDTKKGVWISIITSGIIFGLVHFINITSNGLASTFTQVLSASATGIVFGFIYYKTKNIWTVVFLHGYWDFCLLLSELIPLTELSTNSGTITLLSIITSIIIALSELIILIPFIKNIDEKLESKKIFKYSLIACFAFIFSMLLSAYNNTNDYETQKIHNINLKEYTLKKDNYKTYEINYQKEINYSTTSDDIDSYRKEKYSYSLYVTDSNLVLKNNITNDSVNIPYNDLYDYGLYEINDNYILAIIDTNENGNDIIKYRKIKKDELSNTSNFLEEIANSMNTLLIGEYGNLCTIYDKNNNKEYVSVATTNYGYFVLLEDDKIALLNRDKEE